MTAAVLPRTPRGRHRSPAADEAILQAALEVLAADGYSALTMARVISLAGVSSATLYRRWPTKQTLVAAALASLHAEILDVDTGALDSDIAAFLESIAATLSVRRDDLAEHVALALQRHPEFREAVFEKFLQPRQRVLAGIIARAVDRGELVRAVNSDIAYSVVIGPIHHRAAVLGKPIGPAFRRALTAAAVASLHSLAAG
ncbi:MAG TPA: TetR/AcrR family transcriptional regulator [Ilumatobacteraceae bacterium]